MVVDMLAADERAPGDPASVRATGYLVRSWDIFNRNAQLASTVEHTAKAFLGLTIGCARCHDHKFDPIAQVDYYRLRAFFEPVHIRIDRVAGEPDRSKQGLPRVFDDFLQAQTFLFTRGDETRPSGPPLSPAPPPVIGGEVKIARVNLPLAASCPDKRAFVIDETVAAAASAVRAAATVRARAESDLDAKTRALAATSAADNEAQTRYQGTSKPSEAAAARALAIDAVAAKARAQLEHTEAQRALTRADSALAAATARQRALEAVLEVERLEDDGAKQTGSALWTKAAIRASSLQKKLAAIESRERLLTAEHALERAQQTLARVTASGDPAKDPQLKSAIAKASTEVVEAGKSLAECQKHRIATEKEERAQATTAYTPRPLVYHRAKTTYRGDMGNSPYPTSSTGRRLALARWIVDRRNPLTARVAVNHVWMRHFGEPLVDPVYDFGLRTARPIYQDLLDWLAVEFMESGWSMKRLHRRIVTSRAYQMRSGGGPNESENVRIDPDNRAFWRMTARRMEAEVIRDSLLHLGSGLDTRMGGPELALATADSVPRRSLYFRHARGERAPFLTMFDAPNVEECYRRDETIVPQQALALNHGRLALAQSEQIAASIDYEVGSGDGVAGRAAFIESAFERLLGRAASDAEIRECGAALDQLAEALATESSPGNERQKKARAALVHVLVNHNDFVTIR